MFVHGNSKLLARFDQGEHGLLIRRRVLAVYKTLNTRVCLSGSFGELLDQLVSNQLVLWCRLDHLDQESRTSSRFLDTCREFVS